MFPQVALGGPLKSPVPLMARFETLRPLPVKGVPAAQPMVDARAWHRSPSSEAHSRSQRCLHSIRFVQRRRRDHSRTTKFTNRPGMVISLTIFLPASSSFTRSSAFISASSVSVAISALAITLCRVRPFN
jgi:hypothetical protein